MIDQLYPLKFHPILKERIWGGDKLIKTLKKESESSQIGESWELSDVEGDVSIVSNGYLSGVTLQTLLNNRGEDIIGEKNYKLFGNKFPLLIKFIDAREDLSIQLHPNDALAKQRHNSFGKTEMWYVMEAEENAGLIVGFKGKVTPKVYIDKLEAKKLPEILNFEKVKEGDTYFIEVGRVHAIGAGVLLAEIQQTSDITYRLYDWDRVDDQGNSRELHTELAIDAIDFNMDNDYKVQYRTKSNQSNQMVSCKYFTTNYLQLDGKVERYNNHDSFIIYICVEGEVEISCDDFTERFVKGETILVPACITQFELNSESAKLLEVFV